MHHMAKPTKLRRRIPRTAAIATIIPVPGLLLPVGSETGAGGAGVTGFEVGVKGAGTIGDRGGG